MTTTPLLLTAREAAQSLATSERTLWALTAPRGPIPVVRFGRSVRYAVDDLRDYIDHQKQRRPGPGTSEPSVDRDTPTVEREVTP